MKKLLAKLVQIRSVTGQEKELTNFIAAQVNRLGIKPVKLGNNLLIRIKGTQSKRALVFCGHTDTVAADESRWQFSPWSGKVVDGKLYGVGSSDMKAGLAVMLNLMERLVIEKPACDVFFAFVVGEEVDGHGSSETSKWFAKKWLPKYQEVAGILGEPVGNMDRLVLGHMGNAFVRVEVLGTPAHGASYLHSRDHAVKKMMKISQKISQMVKDWSKKYHSDLLGNPTVGSLTSISAGDPDVPNQYPGKCTATFDFRTTEKLHDKLLKLLRAELKPFRAKIDLVYQDVQPGITNKSCKIAKLMKKITGLPVAQEIGSSDLGIWVKAGVDTVMFGPGDESLAHQANEHCKLSQLDKCLKVYWNIVQEWGKSDEPVLKSKL